MNISLKKSANELPCVGIMNIIKAERIGHVNKTRSFWTFSLPYILNLHNKYTNE